MTANTKPAITYEQRQAIATLRKGVRTNPGLVSEIMKGMPEEVAYHLLKQVSTEIAKLLEVTRAFSQAAAELAKQQKDKT